MAKPIDANTSASVAHIRQTSLALHGMFLVLLACVTLISPTNTHAAEGSDPAIETESIPKQNQDNSAENPDDQRRKETLAKGLLLLGGILFVGMLMIVLVLWGGNRLRRLARKPLPASPRGDELWFLRPPKKIVDIDPSGKSSAGRVAPETEENE